MKILIQKNTKKEHMSKKIKMAKEAIATSIHYTSKKYDIDRTYIRKWIKNIEKLKNTQNKRERKKSSGAGRIPYTFEIEENLVEFIKKYREIGIVLFIHDNNRHTKTITNNDK